MKFVAFRGANDGNDLRVGAIASEDGLYDLTSLIAERPLSASEVNRCFDPESGFSEGARSMIANGTAPMIRRGSVEICPPVPRPGKIMCIGLNYRDHAMESGMALPESPIMFSKFSSCAIGPGEAIVTPSGSSKVDFEAELAVVIGKRAKNVVGANAIEHVFGYMNFNDVSARDFQFADGQWARGKSCDTFAPMGEFIATADEIADPHSLRIRFRLNGETLQDSNTDQLIFRIPQLIEFLSASVTLEPGDIIATGTPPGVGFARNPPVFMKAGDVAEVEIEGLGVLRNPVSAG